MSSSTPDFRALPRHDRMVLVSGVLTFIASFLPWYGAKIDFLGVHESSSTDAWHGLAAFGLVLLLLGLLVTAAEVFASDGLPEVPVGLNVVAAGLACLGALFVIIKSFDLPSASGAGGSVGLRWGGYLLIIFAIIQAITSVLRVVHANDASPAAAPPPPPPAEPPSA